MNLNFETLRKSMVQEQICRRGITDERVLDAFSDVERHEFVPAELETSAYEDCPLPIGSGQTISQPFMVALMSELLGLKGYERVLEIGTGSGYQTAILAHLAKEVYSIERIPKLALAAKERLNERGYCNVWVETGDGTEGLNVYSPYDAIIVTAAAPDVPASLLSQLKPGGKMVIPVGGRQSQMLTIYEKKESGVSTRDVCACVFVPLLGREGWKVNNE
ncbi:MAG: protein-L-isoaspartate(D-aspartate) O-methyltransferase [PVC group bacterium]|nr:protein-L-isoaspartate(D-aspartate) O-methyltransferase [PVC group bacterium]